MDRITGLELDCVVPKVWLSSCGFLGKFLNLSEPGVSHSVMGANDPTYSYEVSIRFT